MPADPVTRYAKRVASGKQPAGKWVRLACERHLADLRGGRKRGLRWRAEAAKLAIDFFGLLRHSKGKWAGESFTLEPWQQFFVGSIFGWKRRNGSRRFRTAHLEVARKNGKSTLAAGIGLLLFLLDGEGGAEVYTVATKRDQARLTHEESVRMVKGCPPILKRVQLFKDTIVMPATHSKYTPLGADADTLDGLNVHGAIADELHAWRHRHLWDVLETATGARSQPLFLVTTTAGFDRNSIWWERREAALKMLDGTGPDDSLFAYVATLDEEDDWRDEATWIKGNPSLGVTVQLDELRERRDQAIATPGKQNAFKRLRLNVPTEQADRWLDMAAWNACGGWDGKPDSVEWLGGLPVDHLIGRECYAGLDLSSTTDLTALVLLFPDGDSYHCVPVFFIPEGRAATKELEDRVPYRQWSDDGFITLTEGDAVDYAAVRGTITRCAELFRVKEIAVDRWNSTQLSQQLTDDGLTVIGFGQGFASMTAPTKELEKLVLSKSLRHAGHPVMAWCASNVAVEQDAAGNLKPSKRKSTQRIDGIVAAVMALGRACLRNGGSVYEARGILTL